MQKLEVQLLAPAWKELDAIAEKHLALVGPQSAEKITTRILDALELLATTPDMGVVAPVPRLAEQGFRMLVVEPYLCFYKKGSGIVEVYHIADGRRDYPRLMTDIV